MLPDLLATRSALRAGTSTPAAELERCIAAAGAPANAHTFLQTHFDTARTTVVQPGMAQKPL